MLDFFFRVILRIELFAISYRTDTEIGSPPRNQRGSRGKFKVRVTPKTRYNSSNAIPSNLTFLLSRKVRRP